MKIVTVADAVAVLDYLHKRELLCQMCGDKVATVENSFHRRCDTCKSEKGVYNMARIPSELERRIVRALNDWVTSNPPDQGGRDAGDAAHRTGGG